MSILVVGSIALDWIKSPKGEVKDSLGGSATYFSYSSSFFDDVRLVGVVGEDFPKKHIQLLKSKKIDLRGLEMQPGKTFRWKGSYIKDLNQAQTINTALNVFEKFKPKIPDNFRNSPFVFLANIEPDLQIEILSQIKKPILSACDTMNLWINIKKKELLTLLKKIDILILNDMESKMLTGKDNLIKAGREILKLGPSLCVIKKGEHGVLLFTGSKIFALPAFPVEEVFDPTGAGDTFAGGFFGYLAKVKGRLTEENLKKALMYGTIMASFTVEDFSLNSLTKINSKHIQNRLAHLQKITQL
ncbi:MAG: PfkB family carbohydrate kinase [bacterium]